MKRLSCLCAALAMTALACSSDPQPAPLDATADRPDATGDRAPDDVTDAAPDLVDASDASVDVLRPPPPPRTCSTCLYDSECGAGGRCVPFDPTNQPGVRHCLTACAAAGGSCDAPVPATCREDDATGDLLCTPTESCVPASSRRAAACPADGCSGRYSVCADLNRTGSVRGRAGVVCLPPCARDADCEEGLRRCLPVRTRDGALTTACVPDDRFGPDVCGVKAVNARGVGAPCDATNACAAGLECAAGVDATITRGFCTVACADDAACGEGARCLALGDRGMRCVPDDCACAAGPRDALLDRALAQGTPAWTRCNLTFPIANLDAFPLNVSRDRFRLPIFDRVHRDWLYGARWARAMGPALDTASSSLSGALAATASMRTDGSTTRWTVPAPTPAPSDGASALADALAQTGATVDRAQLMGAVSSWPAGLAAATARIVTAAVETARARDRGLPFATDETERARLWSIAPHLVLPTASVNERANFTQAFDLGMLLGDVQLPVEASLRLARTIESVDWSALRNAMGPSLDLDTPLGRVIVRDGAAHRYTPSDAPRTLLLLDLGGDDTYTAPVAANVDAATPVSVLVDLAGADTYGYPEVPSTFDTPELLPSDRDGRLRAGSTTPSFSRTGRQGSARLGTALLYDLGAGNDRYRSLRMSQGFAALGVGGLYDDGGDDEYTLEAGGQGAAVAGVSALVDAAGSDRYTAWAYAQGFAYVQGAAMLYDRDGGDVYDAKRTPVLYPSAQDPTVNASFSQGAGFGRRGDAFADRTNMSGGMGILRDRAGDDRYASAIFGTATGYWGGMGLLLDGAGDDRYDGRWYTQGGAAHFAFAALVDGGGRDTHNMDATRQNMTGGAGHDFSLGILLGLGREADTYGVPNLALGAGNANGAGIFADEGGDDVYEAASALTLGNAALETLTDMGRLTRPTVGVFLDGGGRDTYRRPTVTMAPEGDDRAWTQRIHPEAPSERGFGIDGAGDTGL